MSPLAPAIERAGRPLFEDVAGDGAGGAVQHVCSRIAGQDIGIVIAAAVDRVDAGLGQILDIGLQGMRHRGQHRVGALAIGPGLGFDDEVEYLEVIEKAAMPIVVDAEGVIVVDTGETARVAEPGSVAVPDLFTVESSFRRAMMAAELDFVANLADEIRLGKLGGTASWRRMHELRAEGVTFEQMLADPVRYLGEEGRALLPAPEHQ